MAGNKATATATPETRHFSVSEFKALKGAAKILGVGVTILSDLLPKISNRYSLQDFEILDAAADILDVTIGSETESVNKLPDIAPGSTNLAVQEGPLESSFLTTSLSNGNISSSVGNISTDVSVVQAVPAPPNITASLDLAVEMDLNALYPNDLAVAMGVGPEPQTLQAESHPTHGDRLNEQQPTTVQNVPATTDIAPPVPVYKLSSYGIGAFLESSVDPYAPDDWQHDDYSNFDFGSGSEMPMPTGSGSTYNEGMGTIDGSFNSSGIHHFLGNTGSAFMATPQYCTGLHPTHFSILHQPDEQIGGITPPQSLGQQFARDLNEGFSQPASSKPDQISRETIPPPKRRSAAKSTNAPQQGFTNKIQKSRRNISKKTTVARLTRLKGPYLDDSLREQTGNTRRNHSCVRCQIQKSRCHPNPDNLTGICMRCVNQENKIVKSPCLRLILSHCVLYRKSTTKKISPLPRQYPTDSPYQLLELENLRYGQVFKIFVQEFDLSPESAKCNVHTKRSYQIPNTQEFVDGFKLCIEGNAAQCAERILTGANTLTLGIFAKAFEVVKENSGLKSKVVASALKFWIAARSNESGWVIRNPQLIGIQSDLRADIKEVPYIDRQIGRILLNDFLAPLCSIVLRDMKKLYESTKADDCIGKFLATFIILHSCELLVKRQRAVTIKRNWTKTRFTNMNLLNDIHIGTKTILAFYHYSAQSSREQNNGERFSMNWNTHKSPKIAGFTGEDEEFMKFVAREANVLKDQIEVTSNGDKWEDEFWFVGQMFDSQWQPRVT